MGTAETFQQEPYGEAVPYGDPNWYQGWASPYYKPTHHKFRVQVRKFVEEELMPNCNEWDEAKKMDPEIFSKAFKAGWLPCVVGAPWPREFTGDLEPPEHYDYFHELIAIDEVARCGAGGVLWGLFEGLQIGLPPVLNHGTQAQKDLCCADCLQGKAGCLGDEAKTFVIEVVDNALEPSVLLSDQSRHGHLHVIKGDECGTT